jgi:hypothetical protein
MSDALVPAVTVLEAHCRSRLQRRAIQGRMFGHRFAPQPLVPQVAIRLTVNDREETISEYICDWPDCPNVAVEVVGVACELRLVTVVCTEHAREFRNKHNRKP